jgi:MFS family permease
LIRLLAPRGAEPFAATLVAGRALRAFVDGYVAVLLPAYLLALGFDVWTVGVLSTATLLGSALATLAVGAWGHRFAQRRLLLAAALLMVATGLGFAGLSQFWPLLAVAFIGTLNPSAGDVSVFLPLEHAQLAGAAQGDARTRLFARYSLLAALAAAFGALAAAVPAWLTARAGIDPLAALRLMFVVYAAVGLVLMCCTAACPSRRPTPAAPGPALGPSRRIVFKLALSFARFVRRRPGAEQPDVAVADGTLRPVACRRRSVLLLVRTARRGLDAGRAMGGAPHRPAEHDGVHAHSRQPGADRRRVCAQLCHSHSGCCSSAPHCHRWTCPPAPPT